MPPFWHIIGTIKSQINTNRKKKLHNDVIERRIIKLISRKNHQTFEHKMFRFSHTIFFLFFSSSLTQISDVFSYTP